VDQRDSGPSVLDGIANKVLKQLNQLNLVRQNLGQRIVRHHGAAFFDGAAQIDNGLLQRFLTGGIE
jgi:ribosomal protein S19E (S16A)